MTVPKYPDEDFCGFSSYKKAAGCN